MPSAAVAPAAPHPTPSTLTLPALTVTYKTHSYTLTTTETGLTLTSINDTRSTINFTTIDILSLKLSPSPPYTLTLNTMPYQLPKYTRRGLETHTFAVGAVDATVISTITAALTALYPPRNALVLINPVSGLKKGLRQYTTIVAPILTAGNITTTVVTTTHPAHATEYVKEAALEGYDMIIGAGGDGIMYEILAGVKARADSDCVLARIAFGIVPVGSGNGLAKSVTAGRGEKCDCWGVGYLIAKGGVGAGKLMEIGGAETTRYSFLSLTWGVVADIDLDSEVLRFLGPLRFDIYAAYRLFSLKTYKARLSYCKDWDTRKPLPPTSEAITATTGGANWVTVDTDKFVTILALLVPWISMTNKMTNNLELGGDMMKIMFVRRKVGWFKLVRSFLSFDDKASQESHKCVEFIDCNAFRLEPLGKKNTYMNVDGEVTEYETTQAVVKQDGWKLCC